MELVAILFALAVGGLLLTAAANPGKVRDLLTVGEALGVSRQYSW